MTGGRQIVAIREFLRNLAESEEAVELRVHYRNGENVLTGRLTADYERGNLGYYIKNFHVIVRGVRRDSDLMTRTIHYHPKHLKYDRNKKSRKIRRAAS